MRAGLGFDIHRLVEGRKLILSGVWIPCERGLEGVSDADVVIHAVCDGLLGAAGLGDIGEQFPESDARYRDVASSELVARVMEMLAERGLRPISVDVIIYADRPKLGEFKDEMRRNLSGLLSVSPERVGIKCKTYEGLGPIGEGLAIASHALVLVEETGG